MAGRVPDPRRQPGTSAPRSALAPSSCPGPHALEAQRGLVNEHRRQRRAKTAQERPPRLAQEGERFVPARAKPERSIHTGGGDIGVEEPDLEALHARASGGWVTVSLQPATGSELTQRSEERPNVERRIGHASMVEVQECDVAPVQQDLARL